MDLNVLKYVQRTESKGSVPEYKNSGMNTEGPKLPPKPELTPDRLDKLFSKLNSMEWKNGQRMYNSQWWSY